METFEVSVRKPTDRPMRPRPHRRATATSNRLTGALRAGFIGLALGFVAACSTPKPAPSPDHVVGSPPRPRTTDESYVVIEPAETAQPEPRPAASRSRVPSMSQRRITLDVREADIHNVLRLLAEEGGANIVVDADVRGRVTMRLENVTVEDAFLAVLESQGLGWTSRGAVTLVEPTN
jgi:hypothetical protein